MWLRNIGGGGEKIPVFPTVGSDTSGEKAISCLLLKKVA
jgi:hypothetical protein